jgi:hypothetical protein
MKFKDMKNKITTDEDGFKFIREHSIFVGNNPEKCRMCSESTEFIDICSEAHMCSTECQEKFYKEMEEYLSRNPEEDT